MYNMTLFSLYVDLFKKNKPLNAETPRRREQQEKHKRKAKESKVAVDKRFSLLLFFLRVSVSLCERFGFF